MPVPTTKSVVPGASVNIVLKADQSTGCTVSGIVQDVLTRGGHHRGIKVRLKDGRVGRVQSVIAGPSEAEGSEDRDNGGLGGADGRRADNSSRRQHRRMRSQDDQDPPQQSVGLDAYIKPGRSAKVTARERSGTAAPSEEAGGSSEAESRRQERVSRSEPVSLTCPVCGSFKGDEFAVAHHVSEHFE